MLRRDAHSSGETSEASLPDCAALSRVLTLFCVPRTASRASRITAGSCWRMPYVTSARMLEAILSTFDTSRRASTNGELGISAIVIKPMPEPIIASIARCRPPGPSVGGKIVAIKIAPKTIWLVTSGDLVKNEPTTRPAPTMKKIWNGPWPTIWKSRSPTATPMMPPIDISSAFFILSPPDIPRMMTAEIGAKNGCGCPTTSPATQYASAAPMVAWMM